MASRNAMEELRERLIAAFPSMAKTLNTSAGVGEWTGRLARYDDDTIHSAVSKVISEEIRPPTIAHLCNACREITAGDPTVRQGRADETSERDQRLAWDDFDIRVAAGQRGYLAPPFPRPCGVSRHPGYADDSDSPF